MELLIVQSDPFSGPGLMEAQWRLRGVRLRFAFVHKGDPIPELEGAGGLVVMGGRVMPDEDAPFLEPTRALLREAIDGGVPVLGICLGAELLCQATGGGLQQLDAPAIGWQTLERGPDADDDPVFGDVENGQHLLGWHSFVLDPPPDAAVLACTGGDVQAVRVGESAWGVLDHPEQSLSVLSILLAEMAEQAAGGRQRRGVTRRDRAAPGRERGVRRTPGTPVRRPGVVAGTLTGVTRTAVSGAPRLRRWCVTH